MDKQYILDEIRRIAAANGGVAPGKRRFENETGIRETEWAGRHAARWSDLVREAGLSPNALNPPHEEQQLIEQWIALTRRLGRLPTNREIQLEGSISFTFPNPKTFSNRLGPKAQLIDKVRDYC